jgi:peroxiredoxin
MRRDSRTGTRDSPTGAPADQRVPIPDFSAPASTGQTLSLDSFKDNFPMVILFIPDLNDTDGKGMVADLDELHAMFGGERAQVLVVVKATAREVRYFADGEDLTLPVLADANGSMIRSLDVEDEAGRARLSALVVDKDGTLVSRFDTLPAEFPELALDLVRQIQSV